MRVLRYGTRALLVEVADHHHALALYEDLRAKPLPGVIDLVPAACTLLITLHDEASTQAAARDIPSRSIQLTHMDSVDYLEIPTVYDGPDLAAVAALTQLSVSEVIDAHSEGSYVVAFIGFAPGFGYLTGLDPRLHVARRSEPRTKVPPGSVAIAGNFTAVYPGASPGGWQLIGRTELSLWDMRRAQPSLMRPGVQVRFEYLHR